MIAWKTRQIKLAFSAASICPLISHSVTKFLDPRKRLLYFLVFSLSISLSPPPLSRSLSTSLFTRRTIANVLRPRAGALLINYSVGVVPLKIKIGSLSGATWNFFLIRRGTRERRETDERRLPVFYLRKGKKNRVEKVAQTFAGGGNSTCLFVWISRTPIWP